MGCEYSTSCFSLGVWYDRATDRSDPHIYEGANIMPRYVIERAIPAIGSAERERCAPRRKNRMPFSPI